MLLVLFGLFAFIATIAFVEYRLKEDSLRFLFPFTMLVLALVVGLRPDDVDCDYSNYLALYNNESDELTVEFTFQLIASFVKAFFDDARVMFLIYAVLSVSLKAYVIKRYGVPVFLAVLMYFCTSFILHDFNQIRAGVATGFFLLALTYLESGKRVCFFLYAIIATMFHYSAIVGVFLFFLSFKPLSRFQFIFYGSIVPLAYVMYFLGINVFYMIPIPYFEEKMETYEALQRTAGAYEVNVFNLVLLTKIAMAYFLYFNTRLLESENKYFPVLIKVDMLSIAAFVVFTGVPILSFRISELLGVVEVVLYPMIFYVFKPRWVSTLIVILLALILFLIYIFYNNYLYI